MIPSHPQELLGQSMRALGVPITFIEERGYIELPGEGLSCVSLDGETIAVVQLHAASHDGYAQYKGQLPGFIEFSMGRAAVREVLGMPTESGDGCEVPVLGTKPAWDAFRIGPVRVHVEYTINRGSIGMVSISAEVNRGVAAQPAIPADRLRRPPNSNVRHLQENLWTDLSK